MNLVHPSGGIVLGQLQIVIAVGSAEDVLDRLLGQIGILDLLTQLSSWAARVAHPAHPTESKPPHWVTKVPSFIVNDQRLIGPPSFEQLSATIDAILEAAN